MRMMPGSPQPAQFQMPSLAYIASGQTPPAPQSQLPSQWMAQPAPSKIRGVSAEAPPLVPPLSIPVSPPAAPPAPPRFVLSSPEALGIATTLNVAKPAVPQPQAQPAVDWNTLHSRMERLRVLKYEKEPVSTGVRVVLVLPTTDPTRGQPVEAVAQTEAIALTAALDRAEAWMQER